MDHYRTDKPDNHFSESKLTLILDYIQQHYQTLTLAELSEVFHYSEAYLCTLIRQHTGESFTDLIRDLRMADARNYLENSDLTIREIAKRVGYHSTDHFSRVFRSRYQMSPTDYRKSVQCGPGRS